MSFECAWCSSSCNKNDISYLERFFCSLLCFHSWKKSIVTGSRHHTTYLPKHQKYYFKNKEKLNRARAYAYKKKRR